MSGRTLVVRSDNFGDVLLTGPAVRAVAAQAESVVMLAGPRGAAAAHLLPGVDQVVEHCLPWIDPEPPAAHRAEMEALVDRIAALQVSNALIFTSFHQSPLPLALLLRMAGVEWIGAISEDCPGSLLDLRHRTTGDPPEPERALSLARAAGYSLPAGDDGSLAVRTPLPEVDHLLPGRGYVVVHPGASVPARQYPADKCADVVELLARRGHRVVVTGSAAEQQLAKHVAGSDGVNLGGKTTLAELAAVLSKASVVVAPNTGPAHLAAAVGTPVVSLFAPVVPAARWAPYGVPTAVLGDQRAPCKDTRARACPVAGHPCLSSVDPVEVADAADRIRRGASCGS